MAFRRRKAKKDEDFQLVEGDRVRRIHFEDDYDVHLDAQKETKERERRGRRARRSEDHDAPANDGHIERVYRPRHTAPIDEIEFEVDHLESIKAGNRPRPKPASRADLRGPRERTLYTTDRGSRVVEARGPDSRRVIYTSGPSRLRESRFTERAVDEIIKGVDLSQEEVVERETITEYVPQSQAEGKKTPVVKGRTVRKPRKTAAKAKKVVKKPAKKPAKKSAAPKKASKAKAPKRDPKDTKPRVKGAPDTKPGQSAKTLQPQCAALTSAGKQCRNSSRKGSKYCGSHKGYRAS